jgi:hypothetical protein
MRPTVWFDRWVDSGPFTYRDLSRYRVVYAVLMLAMLPDFQWVSRYPDSLYAPPPGPMALLGGFPPSAFLGGVEIAVAVALAFVAFGIRTRAASIAVTVLLLVGYGFAYSLGKIDHTILQVLTPLVLSFAGWGAAGSWDTRRRAARPPAPPQWPVRLLGTLIGLGFVTAAAPKFFTGWLDPDTHAVRATLFRQVHVNGRDDLLANFFLDLQWGFFWEAMDWATVVLEAVLILAVLNWRVFRAALAVTALFHVGVYLMMNIHFDGNVLVYAALLPWGRLRLPRVSVPAGLARATPLLAVALAAAAWALTQGGNARPVLGPIIVLVGGLVAVVHLLRETQALVRARRGRVGGPDVRDMDDQAPVADGSGGRHRTPSAGRGSRVGPWA